MKIDRMAHDFKVTIIKLFVLNPLNGSISIFWLHTFKHNKKVII